MSILDEIEAVADTYNEESSLISRRDAAILDRRDYLLAMARLGEAFLEHDDLECSQASGVLVPCQGDTFDRLLRARDAAREAKRREDSDE